MAEVRKAQVTLPESVFGIEPHVAVMHQVVTAQLAARRSGTQSTLTRAEVRGGGAKPRRQKGTGSSRQGSTRSPQWEGGGVALGPKPRSYRQKTPKKMVQLALRSALSDRARDGKVVVVESWGFDVPRTKDAVAALASLGVADRVLVVLSRDDEVAHKSFRNLTDVQVCLTGELNAYDILCNDWIVFTTDTVPSAGAGGESTKEAPAKAPPTKAAAPEPPAPEAAAPAAPEAASEETTS